MTGRLVSLALLGAVAGMMLLASPTPASAQGRGCYALWYERNEIYARNGYCFRTARARSVFGPGCFPPYGRLTGWEARRVQELQYEEDMRGCPR